ncbi:MAG: (Fe-S)-binding protein [Planctomycetes bacterium]|nr:(Fe-S)-binding protein [Planctomycetota bacterium]
MNIRQQPRQLLTQLGYELVELPDPDRCCGFGGSFTVKYPDISGAILEHKIESIKKTGAQKIALDCPGCLLHIQGGLNKQNTAIKARRTAEIVADELI